MINCKNCGVQLDEHMNFCPVCGVPVLDKEMENSEKLIREKQAGTRKLKKEIEMLNKSQKAKFFWEVVSIILGLGILSTTVLDFLLSKSFTWSGYVVIGALTLFLYVTIFSFAKKEFWVISALVFVATVPSILLLDLVDKNISWSIHVGVPLLFAIWMVVFLVIAGTKYSREKGFNLIAIIFLAFAALALSAEGIISRYLDGKIQFSWSIIVLFSILPVAATLLYIHYKLKKGTDLRKFFHI